MRAQTAPQSVAPGQIEKRFEAPVQPRPRSEPLIPRIEGQSLPPQAGDVRFTLSGLMVEGATVFDEADFVPYYQDFLAREVSLADVFAIAQAITDKYQQDGYILSRAIVPEQQVDLGIMRIRVIEGYLDRIVFRGAVEGRPELLQAYAEKITNVHPLRRDVFERYLLLMDDLPGLTAAYNFAPSDTAPGAHTLTITLDHDTVEGFVRVDNRGSRYVGPYQGWAGVSFNSVLGLYESTQARFITTGQTEELQYFDVVHTENLGTEGTKLTLSASRSRSFPGFTLESADVESRGRQFEIGVAHPLIRSQKEDLFLSARFNVGEFTRDESDVRVFEDSLRVVRLGARYSFTDTAEGRNAVSFEASHGLSTFGASDADSLLLSRAGGRPDFTKATLELSRYQPLAPKWGLLVLGTAQKSAHRLLLSEQMGIGGEAFGRAYDPSEITGDDGAAFRAEVQQDETLGGLIRQHQIFAYYDVGKVWQRGSNVSAGLASVGLGVRFLAAGNLLGSVEIAKPLTRPVETMGDDGNDPRIFFTLTASF